MNDRPPDHSLPGKVALVAGATRGAGRAIAVELARAGAFVYATGRSSRATGPSELDRPETIEETGDMMLATGGAGLALQVDHLDPDAVADLVARIEAERVGSTSSSTTSSAVTDTCNGTRSSGSTTSPEACAC
jgi:NAD(P)-dependent dehydrogenase (short-subunit alcohol dehydrogenase family)